MRRNDLLLLAALALAIALPGRDTAVGAQEITTPPAALNHLQLPAPDDRAATGPELFVRNWLVLGPFTYQTGKHGGEQDQGALKVEFVPNEAALDPQRGIEVGGQRWQRYRNEPYTPQEINLDTFYGANQEFAAAYAAAIVVAPQALENLTLLTGSDDYMTVWINGEKAFEYDEQRRKNVPDDDRTTGIRLREGPNKVIVKCVDVVYGWGFHLRFADAQGRPLRVVAAPPVAATNYLQPQAEAAGELAPTHFVRDWLILGPFTYQTGKHGGEQDQGAVKVEFVPNESQLQPELGVEVAQGRRWIPYENMEYEPQHINLEIAYDRPEFVAAYAACTVYAPRAMENLTLLTGSDDYLVVWINGGTVMQYDQQRRAAKPDQDKTPDVALKEGPNTVLVKCVDVVQAWGFYLRFADAQGRPIVVTSRDSEEKK